MDVSVNDVYFRMFRDAVFHKVIHVNYDFCHKLITGDYCLIKYKFIFIHHSH